MQQAVWVWTPGRGWTPKRGIHAGLRCEECGEARQIMYEGRRTFCIRCASAVLGEELHA